MLSYEHLKRVLREWDGPPSPPPPPIQASSASTYSRRPQPLYQRIIAAGEPSLFCLVLYYIGSILNLRVAHVYPPLDRSCSCPPTQACPISPQTKPNHKTAVAGIFGWLVIYPLDVAKSRLQADALAPGQNRYSGLADCFRQTIAQGGVRALFNGLGFTLIRAVPVASVILPTYDWTFFHLSVALGVEPSPPVTASS
jgi:hypothetical protein